MNHDFLFFEHTPAFLSFLAAARDNAQEALKADVSCHECPFCHKPLRALSFCETAATYAVFCAPCNYLLLVEQLLCSPFPSVIPSRSRLDQVTAAFDTFCNYVQNQLSRPLQ